MKCTWIKLYINEHFLKYIWVKASLKRNNIKKKFPKAHVFDLKYMKFKEEKKKE